MRISAPSSSVQICRSGLSTTTSPTVWMSPAVTTPGPDFFTTMRLGPSPCILIEMSLMLSTMSVTSSRTPAIEENSCSTPSMCTDCTAAPWSEESRIRRSALPSVWPKPRSSGSATMVAKRVESLPGWIWSLFGRISSCQFFWIVTVSPIQASQTASADTGVGERPRIIRAALQKVIAGDQCARNLVSNAPTLAGTATVVRDRGHVADRGDGEARGLKRPERRFAARTGTGDFDFQRAHAVLLRLLRHVLGGNLCGIRGRLARTLEAHRAGGGPGNRVALRVGDGDGRVVERRVHVRDAGGDVLALTTTNAGGFLAHRLPFLKISNAAVMPAATPVERKACGERVIPGSPHAVIGCENLLLLAGDRLGRTLARARIGVGTLATHRQTTTMAQAAVAAEVHQTLDVDADLTTQIALDEIVAVDHFADLKHFGVAELIDPTIVWDLDLLHDLTGDLLADAMDVLERDQHALVGRDVHAGNTGHGLLSCRRSLVRNRALS